MPDHAAAIEAAADVLLERFAAVGVDPLIFLGGAGELAGEIVEALTSPRETCPEPLCEGTGHLYDGDGHDILNVIDLGVCPTCNGSGTVPADPYLVWADEYERAEASKAALVREVKRLQDAFAVEYQSHRACLAVIREYKQVDDWVWSAEHRAPAEVHRPTEMCDNECLPVFVRRPKEATDDGRVRRSEPLEDRAMCRVPPTDHVLGAHGDRAYRRWWTDVPPRMLGGNR